MRFFRPAVRVALAAAQEAPALAQLYERVWADCEGRLDPRLVADQRAAEDEVRAWLSGGFEVYRSLHEGRVVAAVRCSFPTSTCHVDRLVVDPELRRRGLGRGLVEHAVARARRAGVTRVWTELTPKLEDAMALFRRLGFRESGRYLAAYWGEPVVLLELPI
jgi:GNAT superfamily N-acetyltransferase